MHIYDCTDVVLANIFHANVCSTGLRTCTIGLFNFIQIQNLYKEIDSSLIVDVIKNGIKKDFSIFQSMHKKYKLFMDTVFAWINNIK